MSSLIAERDPSNPSHSNLEVPLVTDKESISVWWFGLFFGVATQLFFLWTAWNLFLFLRYGAFQTKEFHPVLNLLLAIFFAWPHSLLLAPSAQKRIKRWIPAGWLGLLHCNATCLSLWFLYLFWTPSQTALWRLDGWSSQIMLLAFYTSWVGLFYSLYFTGMGYQTGLIPWWSWLRKKTPPRRPFVTWGAFRFMRHPVYLSFLGLIWFTPTMTLDHVILTMVWTIYIYVGSFFKDRRLEHFIGEPYREYSRRVTGFPIIGFGPWGKR